MTKINLIAGYQEKKVQTKKLNNNAVLGSVIFIVVVVAVIVIISGVTVTQKTIKATAEKKIDTTNVELSKYKVLEEKVISLEKGLAGAKDILNGKFQWTKLLVHIEAATPKDIKFTRLKVLDNRIEADLSGTNVNSLARFIDSFKQYQVLDLKGVGKTGQSVIINAPDGEHITSVKTDGSWNHALQFDPSKDVSITVTIKGEAEGESDKTSEVKYSATEKKITAGEGVSANNKKLFTKVDSKGYTKETDGKIKFSVTMDFDGGLIW